MPLGYTLASQNSGVARCFVTVVRLVLVNFATGSSLHDVDDLLVSVDLKH
jgi:hypothetical protein